MNGLWTIEFGQLGATLKALQDVGVTLDHLDRLRSDSAYAHAVAEVMLSSRSDGSSKSHSLARGLLGRNYFGVEEWLVYYGVVLTDQELAQVSEFPWRPETLLAPCPFYKGMQIKDTHFAYLGLSARQGVPLTIMEFVSMHPGTEHPMFKIGVVYSVIGIDNSEPGYWYAKEEFACHETCEFKWFLSPIDNFSSWNRKPKLQQVRVGLLVPENYFPLSAVELVTRNLLYYRKYGTAPISEMGTRTRYEHLGKQTRILCSYSHGDNGGVYICCPPEDSVVQSTEYALTRK